MGHAVKESWRVAALAGGILIAAFGCRARSAGEGEDAADKTGKNDGASSEAAAATPVRIAAVEKATLAEIVTAPGKITAMAQAKIRAPFPGTLTDLSVTDGDPVHAGETIGVVVARDSEAALSGAREMERSASTPAERADGARAVALAEKNLVRTPLKAAADGVVVAHSASAGDRVTEDEELVSIAETRSLVLLADVPQARLPSVRAGQAVEVAIAGAAPVAGRVHDVLPAGATADLTAPVRIDLAALPRTATAGLFATARITVAEHQDVVAVPDAAVLRDDVTGASRVALVGSDGKAHWTAVTPGLSQGGKTEIAAPAMVPGTRVIVSGQVGLPDGAPVAPAP